MTPAVSRKRPLLAQGRAALARGEWADAQMALEKAVSDGPEDGEAWEALAYAYTWLQQDQRAIEARQHAYSVYRDQADDLSAARVCLDLVYDFIETRGEPAVANGWLRRARRLLEDRPLASEHALLRIWDAFFTLDTEPQVAEKFAAEAVSIARETAADDVGVLALAVHGLALVTHGRVADGMSLLDEAVASAIGREITDPQWYYFACCCMIDACDRVRDFARSLAWCDQLREFAERWRVQAFLTTCRIKYTAALLWRGDWSMCEAQLERAIEEMVDKRPLTVAGALVRLAELRRRQGRQADSEDLLARAAGHPLALQVRAALILDGGDFATALELLETLARRTTRAPGAERVTTLEMQARAHAGLGQLHEARATAAELAVLAETIGTDAIRATSLVVAGIIANAARDHEHARRLFTDAAYLAEQTGSRYEAARARLELARTLLHLGRIPAAAAEASAAAAVFDALGAGGDAARAAKFLDGLEEAERAANASTTAGGLLTRRQQEVLSLIAQGLSDQEIAARLFLSEHTVHRHVANVLTRLGASSRAAAVATALRTKLL